MTHWFLEPERPPRVLSRRHVLTTFMATMLGELASLENHALIADCDHTGHIWWARKVEAP